jgi:hypothetical protein
MFVELLWMTILIVICLLIYASYWNPLDLKFHFLGNVLPTDLRTLLFFRMGPFPLHA